MNPSCVLKELPADMLEAAAATAIEINPLNAPVVSAPAAFGVMMLPQRNRIAMLTSKYWGPKVDLSVQFLDTSNADLKAKILSYANKWGQYGNIKFRETGGTGDIRIARAVGEGYWSYLGTDIRSIPKNQPTMNLESFSLGTSDSEYSRVVCHEFGHTLGFPHEHSRQEILNLLDIEKTVAWFQRYYGWDRNTTIQQVFTALNPASIRATQADSVSIMCYQFSGEVTKNGQPIPGGMRIDELDQQFVRSVFPPVDAPPPPNPSLPAERTNFGITYGNGTQLSFQAIFAEGQKTGTISGTCSRPG